MSTPTKFRSYPINPTTLKAAQEWSNKIYQRYDLASYLSEGWQKAFLSAPLSRVVFTWQLQGRSGLSPFALAGISGVPPKEVVKYLASEECPEFLDDMFLCCTVQLPVIAMGCSPQYDDPEGHNQRPCNDQPYQEDIDAMQESVDYWLANKTNLDPYDDRPRLPVKGTLPWGERTLDKMLQLYGGRDWKRYCKRLFNPFKARNVRPVTPAQWKLLKFAYTLGLEESEVEANHA